MAAENILALGDNQTLQELAARCAVHKTKVYLFNPLKIVPLPWENKYPLNWSHIEKIIVTSKYAVLYGLNNIVDQLLKNTPVFSLGPNTASYISRSDLIKIHPACFHSEALLELPELLSIKGQQIVIFKPLYARDLLQQTLQQRAAILYTIACYKQEALSLDLTPHLQKWKENAVTQLIVSSTLTLHTFISQVPQDSHNWLKKLTLIVSSNRLKQEVLSLGFKQIKCATHFSVAALFDLIF